ncbi:potassium channel subfamily K member 17-like [Argiope bruennichi]|uniref:potassium channel subfamily K member 17-like n=1 Tax=Argiope bruennichi TaxID=94029 RepID=UPI002494417B|nr:potassium channel subfamily K member 17-like [Argiope bruennichi]
MGLERKRSSRRGPRRKRPPENKCKSCCRRFTAFMFSHVGLCALVVGYSILGAFAFQALEAPYEEKKVDEVMHKRSDTVRRLWAITDNLNVLYKENWTRQVTEEVKRFQAELVHAIKEGYDGKEGTGTQWTFSGAFLYSLTVITTIGYGNIAPRTPSGKLATIFYAIIGIPLMLLYLTNIGDILAKAFRYLYSRACACTADGHGGSSSEARRRRYLSENYRVQHVVGNSSSSSAGRFGLEVDDKFHLSVPPPPPPPLSHIREDEVRIEPIPDTEIYREDEYNGKARVSVPITLCMVILVGYISGGAVLFSLWEGWGFLDGSYFCFVTLSTIGFGDLVPGDSVISEGGSQEKLVMCSLYLLFGMALIAMCFNLMQEEVIHKVRSCGKRIGIIKDQEDDDDMG